MRGARVGSPRSRPARSDAWGAPTMAHDSSPGGSTDPILLDRVRAWDDHPAWRAFHAQYDPLITQWCRRFPLDAESAEELRQRFWIELSERMRTFRYDPSGTFRGWLWRFFGWRARDLGSRNGSRLKRML